MRRLGHSQDGSVASGGDLGWFEENMMVKPFKMRFLKK